MTIRIDDRYGPIIVHEDGTAEYLFPEYVAKLKARELVTYNRSRTRIPKWPQK
jgi:hypothetical protein